MNKYSNQIKTLKPRKNPRIMNKGKILTTRVSSKNSFFIKFVNGSQNVPTTLKMLRFLQVQSQT